MSTPTPSTTAAKRRIILDLRLPDERRIAERLVASADVVVENFRPGVMDRLGLGAEMCTAANPALVYCSIPGFASDDPRRDVAAWEGVVGAATDMYPSISQLLEADDPRTCVDPVRPVLTALALASNFAGFHAATAIVMALIERQRSGLGQRIEVPMFDAMFELIGANGISLNGVHPVGRTRGSHTITCADGRRVLFNSTSSPRFQRFAEAAGVTGDGRVRRALSCRMGDADQHRRRPDHAGPYATGVAGQPSRAGTRRGDQTGRPRARAHVDAGPKTSTSQTAPARCMLGTCQMSTATLCWLTSMRLAR
jgi:crotonobetainyl-CoA:carnitine CoA-transferase CaiB-like acyl-CoA transferase